ncbi:hypothetical protein RhiirB3_445987 [Rhizophagus irregularis]|nr:hypothetical protein RhiirB3_445987 [Rhizophagus irregularis]
MKKLSTSATAAVLSDFLAITDSFGFPWHAALRHPFFRVLEREFQQTAEFSGIRTRYLASIFFEPPDVGLAVFQVSLDLGYWRVFESLLT